MNILIIVFEDNFKILRIKVARLSGMASAVAEVLPSVAPAAIEGALALKADPPAPLVLASTPLAAGAFGIVYQVPAHACPNTLQTLVSQSQPSLLRAHLGSSIRGP